jgi:ATP-dependent helicase/nuclease subunit B
LIPGFPDADDPLALSRATIYVPTQRAAAALTQALLSASGRPTLILPRIAPLGAFEPSEISSLLGDPNLDSPSPEIPPAVGELTRRMTLARLTRAWGQALSGAIRGVGADGEVRFDESEPALVAASPAQAFALASDLAALIDDMIIEGVAWEKLKDLAPEAYDLYWGITLEFLKIAMAEWPRWLEERGLIDRARRVGMLVDAEVGRLDQRSPRGPTIVAGSTGTNRATRRLIAAIAHAPQGAVVLPGLDQRLDDAAWAMIGAGEPGEGAAGHPQAALRRLIEAIGVARNDVLPLGAISPGGQARLNLLSEALRPAASTEAWRSRDQALAPEAVGEALAGVCILTAENESEEALALAIAMREILETPAKTAALVTPDAGVARRVAAELARWGVEVEDSAGRTLGQSEAGALARLVLQAAIDFTPAALCALFAHAATRISRSRAALESAARALEVGLFRVAPPAPPIDDPGAAFAFARAAASGSHAHPAVRRLTDDDWRAAETLLADVSASLAPLRSLQTNAPLSALVEAHRSAVSAIVGERAAAMERARPALEAIRGGGELTALFDEWAEAAKESFSCSLNDYSALFDEIVAGERAPAGQSSHPRLQILGLLEARLLDFDCVLLAGLDEKTWPPAVETDAFLNRPMREQLGLSPPERRVGQTAHDFVAAMGAGEAILSRAKKRGGEPTVASRFLQRIAAAAGADAITQAEARGERYLAFARGLDQPAEIRPMGRPEPRPAKDRRPVKLSVTRIETLRRDPYAVYAEQILKLNPLNPIGGKAGPSEIGTAWHAVLQAFTETFPPGPLPEDAGEVVVVFAREAFAPLLADESFAGLVWPNIVKALEWFVGFERDRRAEIVESRVECDGRIDIRLSDHESFALTARADRIDVTTSGEAVLIDYKTGAPPGVKEVKVGFAPQLTLEAAMLARGGFPPLGPRKTADALYVKIGGSEGGKARPAAGRNEDFAALVEKHYAELIDLVRQFADPRTPYLSRPFPKFANKSDTYDHLARVREWSATSGLADGDSGDES